MRALVFGASAGIGRQLARQFAARGYDLTLLARDERDIEAEAAHCMTLYGVTVDCVAVDAAELEGLNRLLDTYVRASGHQFHVLAFPVGGAFEPDEVGSDPRTIEAIVNANLTSVLCALRHLLPQLDAGSRCTVVGFGSVAAVRGRTRNVAYAAAKRGLQSYFESLRHTFADRQVLVQFYQLGYVATQQSYGKSLSLPVADPARVARHVVSHLDDDFGCRYLPRYWALLTLSLRALPWRAFRRLQF